MCMKGWMIGEIIQLFIIYLYDLLWYTIFGVALTEFNTVVDDYNMGGTKWQYLMNLWKRKCVIRIL